MAEELVIANKSDLVNIADSIRNLNGTSDSMNIAEMSAAVDDASGDLSDIANEQSDLIEQIKTALEGKAGGGSDSGGDTNNIITITTEKIESGLDYFAVDGTVNTMTSYSTFEVLNGVFWDPNNNDLFGLEASTEVFKSNSIWMALSNTTISYW